MKVVIVFLLTTFGEYIRIIKIKFHNYFQCFGKTLKAQVSIKKLKNEKEHRIPQKKSKS